MKPPTSTPQQLGQLEFASGMSPLVVVLLAGSFLLVLIAILLGWTYRDLIKESEIGAVLGLFGLIPLLCGLYGLQMLLRKQSIKVYENGFVYKGRGETETVFWRDIQDFNEAITLYLVQGVPVTKREYSVTASGGQTIVLGQDIRNVSKIGERIKQETFKRRFPDALNRVLNGQAIRFGSVTLTRDTLIIRDNEIDLGKVKAVQSLNGKIVVTSDSLFRISDIDYATTPNAHVLFALLTKLTGKKTG